MKNKLTIEDLVGVGADESEAPDLQKKVNGILSQGSEVQCWNRIIQEILTPEQPFDLHILLYNTVTPH